MRLLIIGVVVAAPVIALVWALLGLRAYRRRMLESDNQPNAWPSEVGFIR